jgi:hypothetical protein
MEAKADAGDAVVEGGGGGLGDAPVFVPAEMRNVMEGREKELT